MNLPDVKTRNISSLDINPIFVLGQKMFDWPTEKVLWTGEIVNWYLENARPYCFVAISSMKLVGFILCFVSQKTGRVEWVAVENDFQGRGVASELMRRALLSLNMKGITQVSALVREDNKAETFFSRVGFRNTGLKKIEMELSR